MLFLLSHIILKTILFGYEMRIAGGSEMTAIYAGINAKQKAFCNANWWWLCRLAGGVELLSQTHRVSTGISQGFGYTAIIVAVTECVLLVFFWLNLYLELYLLVQLFKQLR